jgi:hypothetical protein
MRCRSQGPRQRNICAGFKLRCIVDGNTTIGQRPARAVPAGVLNTEVKDRHIGNRSLGYDSIELLGMDAMR